MENRIYIAKRETTGEFIAIEHGTTGFCITTVYDQDHADVLNERQDITPADAEAAMICSMFGNWHTFDDLAARCAKPKQPQTQINQ